MLRACWGNSQRGAKTTHASEKVFKAPLEPSQSLACPRFPARLSGLCTAENTAWLCYVHWQFLPLGFGRFRFGI